MCEVCLFCFVQKTSPDHANYLCYNRYRPCLWFDSQIADIVTDTATDYLDCATIRQCQIQLGCLQNFVRVV